MLQKMKMFSAASPAHGGQLVLRSKELLRGEVVETLNPVPHQLAAGWCGTPMPPTGRKEHQNV